MTMKVREGAYDFFQFGKCNHSEVRVNHCLLGIGQTEYLPSISGSMEIREAKGFVLDRTAYKHNITPVTTEWLGRGVGTYFVVTITFRQLCISPMWRLPLPSTGHRSRFRAFY